MGRFFNLVGPFLGAVPVTTQITGTSDHSVLPMFKAPGRRRLRRRDTGSRWNDIGADELLSHRRQPGVRHRARRGVHAVADGDRACAGGTFDELQPVDDLDATVAALHGADRRRRAGRGDREHQAQRGRAGAQRRDRGGLAGGAPDGRRRDGRRRAGAADRVAARSRRSRLARGVAAAKGAGGRSVARSSPTRVPAGPASRCS